MNRRSDSKLSKGNMEFDVGRILLQPTFELTTDIGSHALTALEQSSESISGWKTWIGPRSLHPKELCEVLVLIPLHGDKG